MSYKTDIYDFKTSSNNNNSSSGGIGILGVLQIVFIVLKCLNVIDWPWSKVLIPFWIWLGLFIFLLIVLFGYEAYLNRKCNNTK